MSGKKNSRICKNRLTMVHDDGFINHVENPDPAYFDMSKVFRGACRTAFANGIVKAASGLLVGGAELAEKLYQKIYPNAEESQGTDLPETKVKKSTTMMEFQDGAEIETGMVANELAHANQFWLQKLREGMDAHEYGDIPVEFELGTGTLFLTKVGDGMFSGIFHHKVLEINEETSQAEEMVDTAKVRIERMTLPSLTVFLEAKGWITRGMGVVAEEFISEDLKTPVVEVPEEAIIEDVVRDVIDYKDEQMELKLRMISLLDKLISS